MGAASFSCPCRGRRRPLLRSTQLLQQRLRLAQVACVEALAEPRVQRAEKSMSLGGAVMGLEPAAEARRGTELVRPRALALRDGDRVAVGRLAGGRLGTLAPGEGGPGAAPRR